MEKVKTFFHIFLYSFIPHEKYYKKILRARFSYSLKYFITLLIVLQIFFVLLFCIKLSPQRLFNTLKSLRTSLQTIPEEFVLNIRQGNLTSYSNRPFFLWIDVEKERKPLLVIDEKATPDKIEEYQSCILLTSKYIVIKNPLINHQSVNSLNFITNRTINKQTINEVQKIFDEILKYYVFIFIAGLFVLFLFLVVFSFAVSFVFLLISNCLVYGFSKYFMHQKLHFSKVVQISFHAVTLPLVLDYFLQTFNISSKILPFLFLALITLFISAGIYEATYLKKGRH